MNMHELPKGDWLVFKDTWSIMSTDNLSLGI